MNFVKKIFLKKKYNATSIAGRKHKQEDEWYVSKKKKNCRIIFVADGLGGHNHGDFASKTVVRTFSEEFKKAKNIDIQFIRNTIMKAANKILEKSNSDKDFSQSGTTLSGILIDKDRYYSFNVGDSRVYHYDNYALEQITKDHSEGQRLVDMKFITEAEAMEHPKKNIINSAIGMPLNEMQLDIEGEFKINKKDIILVCSDGIHDIISSEEIKKIIENCTDFSKLSEILVNTAYNMGAIDNITACVYRH